MPDAPQNLIWIDLEMTGLDPDNDVIIEMATIITDTELNHVADGPVLAIHQPKSRLDAMDEWNTQHHTQSGLVERVLNSEITTERAEAMTLAFIQEHVAPNSSPICGNSIGQDRRFLYRYMPTLEAYFHYRNLDVSTVKELARYWNPGLLKKVTKKSAHLALDDIRDSIEELRIYKTDFFKH